MSPTHLRRHRHQPGRNLSRRRKVHDRIRENSVVRTFGPLNRSLSFELPKIVVQSEDTSTDETKSTQEFNEEGEDPGSISDNNGDGCNEKEGKISTITTPKASRWHSQSIRNRLLRSVARKDGDKVKLLLPLAPVYGRRERDAGDAIRSWIRTNTQGSRWSAPDAMAGLYVSYPFTSVATQTDPLITASPPMIGGGGGDGGGDDGAKSSPSSASSASRWDKLVDMEWSGVLLRASTPHKSQDLASEGASVEVDVRGGGQVVGAGGQQGGAGRRLPDPVEVSSVTYLSVPETPASRRPSTADLVIEKLQVEKVEGGGLSIQGVALASNCHVTLIVFGVFFMLAGVVLSYVSYSVTLGAGEEGPEGKEKTAKPEDHLASVAQMRMIGPAFLLVGFLMVGLGITLFILARKISRDEKVKQLVISEQQLCELESSFSYTAPSPLHTAYPAPHQQFPILAVRRNSWWIDSVPRDSTTPGEAQDSAIQCPSPIEESRAGSPTRILPPVALEMLPDLAEPPAADIACFPPSTSQSGLSPDVQTPPPVPEDGEAGGTNNTSDKEGSLTEVRSDIPVLSTAAQEVQHRIMSGAEYRYAAPPRLTAEGQDIRSAMFKPSSAAHSRSHGVPVPSSAGQIPSIQVTAPTPVLPPLPRLSRHHATRPDSRPTTADSR